MKVESDGVGVGGGGERQAEAVVDHAGHALGGGEVGVAQAEMDDLQAVEGEGDFALDGGPVRDAPGGGDAAGDGLRRAARRDRPGRDRTLRHGIDLAIGAEQGGDHQRAAHEVGRIAERGDGDVDAVAVAGERGKLGGDHDRGDVLGRERLGLVHGVDAEPLKHADQRLAGEDRGHQPVAGAVEADDEPIADELVGAHAFDVGDVLDADLRRGLGDPAAGEDEEGGETGERRLPLLPPHIAQVRNSQQFCVILRLLEAGEAGPERPVSDPPARGKAKSLPDMYLSVFPFFSWSAGRRGGRLRRVPARQAGAGFAAPRRRGQNGADR